MLPKDPYALLSYVNLKLRDYYSNLDELCKKENIDLEKLIDKLKEIDYYYDSNLNQFK